MQTMMCQPLGLEGGFGGFGGPNGMSGGCGEAQRHRHHHHEHHDKHHHHHHHDQSQFSNDLADEGGPMGCGGGMGSPFGMAGSPLGMGGMGSPLGMGGMGGLGNPLGMGGASPSMSSPFNPFGCGGQPPQPPCGMPGGFPSCHDQPPCHPCQPKPCQPQPCLPQGQSLNGTSVWGDPHITSPNGNQQQFTSPNGLFINSNGSSVLVQAPGYNQQATSATAYAPGQDRSIDADPTQTQVYENVNGQVTDVGSAASMGIGYNANNTGVNVGSSNLNIGGGTAVNFNNGTVTFSAAQSC